MSTASLPPRLTCTRCGEIVPGNVDTEVRSGRAVRECPRCDRAVDVEEVIRCQS